MPTSLKVCVHPAPAPWSRFPAPIGPEARTMPAEHGFRFDGLHRVENVGSQRIHAGKSQPVDAGEGQTARGLGRSTFSWWRSTRSSASSAARDRNSRAKAHRVCLQRSIIARKHQPIRAGFLARLGFRQGQWCARIADLGRIDEEPMRVPFWPPGLLPATFAKPSTDFTNSLPSFFALLSGLWLKYRPGAT